MESHWNSTGDWQGGYCVTHPPSLHMRFFGAYVAYLQYIPRKMHTVFALLCFVVVIHWLIFPYPSGLLHWHCGNLTIAPVPAKQPWWIWINTSSEFIMNDCITTAKQSTTKPCAYFLGYIVSPMLWKNWCSFPTKHPHSHVIITIQIYYASITIKFQYNWNPKIGKPQGNRLNAMCKSDGWESCCSISGRQPWNNVNTNVCPREALGSVH